MRHPMMDLSLTPYGFAFPLSVERLAFNGRDPRFHVNSERIIAQHWDRANRSNASPVLPAEKIIHRILPDFNRSDRILNGDFVFADLPYLNRDILVLSSTVQWLGAHCGTVFVEGSPLYHDPAPEDPALEFVHKFDQERKKRSFCLALLLTHVCSSRCNSGIVLGPLGESPHRFDPFAVQHRDRIVMRGLMHWLGSTEGRMFLSAYQAEKKAAHEKVRRLSRESLNIA